MIAASHAPVGVAIAGYSRRSGNFLDCSPKVPSCYKNNEATQCLTSEFPLPAKREFLLRVFGRLSVSGVTRCSEAGVRKASGEETAGKFRPAVVSVYGDLACVCPDLWISNGDHGRVIIVALALVVACRIGAVVL